MTEGELIAAVIASKTGDREFFLDYSGEDSPAAWYAAIGNNLGHVSLGEATASSTKYADFIEHGATAKEALEKLLAAVRGAK